MPPPETGGGKIAVEQPIVAPIPPPRSVWAVVFPVTLIFGVIGLIVIMYASGMRSMAGGFGIFGFMAMFGVVGMMMRNRGAAQKMSWSELMGQRRSWMARQDEIRDEVDAQRRKQWEHRRHFHCEPTELVEVPGTVRMWDRAPGSEAFAVARVGVGKVALAMTIEKPKIVKATHLEPATGHALRKFLNEQEYIEGMPKAIWLQRFPGISLIGAPPETRSLTRALLCQLAAFHGPSDLQIVIVSAAPAQWEWTKWLPHVQHVSSRDGCGERRLMFSSPARLEAFLDEDPDGPRQPWSPPSMSSGLHGGTDPGAVLPLRIVIDDGCGTPEDWAGMTGSGGYAGTCFIRLAETPPPRPPSGFGHRYWVGFDPATSYRLVDGALRKQLPRGEFAALVGPSHGSDELDDAFYATADQMSVTAAERVARAMARYRDSGAAGVTVSTAQVEHRNLLDVLGIRDPRDFDVDRLWAPRMTQGPAWMRFPVGLDESGQVVELDLKEGSQRGMGMHSLFVGTTGAGKSEGIITEVSSLAATHSPEVVNIVFSDFKLKSAAGVLEKFPHVVAAVSNLADERHLVGRMYDALDGELDRRGAAVAALEDCQDLNDYNRHRLTDPSLPPIPVLWVICDEYNEMLADPIWGPKFRRLFWRIGRLGRAYHIFLQLVGQVVDTQNLRDVRKVLGFTIAGRTSREEDSREAIGSSVAAHVPEEGAEGTAYLRVALRQPREFKFFYSSAKHVPRAVTADSAEPLRAGTWFEPRTFTVDEAVDLDGLLATPAHAAQPEPVIIPDRDSGKIVDGLISSLRATGVRPPRPFWLPPLAQRDAQGQWRGRPSSVDELVLRLRGKPWQQDYGMNPGLSLPVALVDRPRDHRQDVYSLDLLSDNALVICAPQRGATTAMMTMVTAGALMYRPERVQFYCIAASGPQLAQIADLPHVAAVVSVSDTEGVNRLLATCENIVAERDRIFTTRGLDMQTVREQKFGPQPRDVGVEGGDVVLVLDGLENFTKAHENGLDAVMRLMNARNYGVRVVVTHNSMLAGMRSQMRNAANQVLEMRLVNPIETTVPTDPADPQRRPAKEVPDSPGRGITGTGHHLMVAVPVLAQGADGPVEARGIGAQVARVAGVHESSTVLRLPASVPFAEVMALAEVTWPAHLVPFGLSETTLRAACLDFSQSPHAVATGLAASGRTNFLRTVMHAIMARYSPQAATIVLFDPTRKLVGVVPEDPWLASYAYNRDDIRTVCNDLAEVMRSRQPPPGTSQTDLLTKQFWTGREFFVVVDDISSWHSAEHPMSALAPFVEQAADLGLHIIATAEIRSWSFQSQSAGVLGRIVGSLAPVLVLDGRRQHGQIMPGVFADAQRPGKGKLVSRSGEDGVLVAWSEPPQLVRRQRS